MRSICVGAVIVVGLAIPVPGRAQGGRGAAHHTFTITPGRHEWRLWRPHLYEFAQLLFTEKKADGTHPQ